MNRIIFLGYGRRALMTIVVIFVDRGQTGQGLASVADRVLYVPIQREFTRE